MSSIGERRDKSRVEFVRVAPIELPIAARRARWAALLPALIILIATLLLIAPSLRRLHPEWPWAIIPTFGFILALVALVTTAFEAWRAVMREHARHLNGDDGDPR